MSDELRRAFQLDAQIQEERRRIEERSLVAYHLPKFGKAIVDVSLFDRWYRSKHPDQTLTTMVEELLEHEVERNYNRIDLCMILADAKHTP